MKGMTTCKVCGRDFALMIEEHYVARDLEKKGVLSALSGEVESGEYDAFDCPHCGCQNIMQSRKPALYYKGECPCEYGICDECDNVEEDGDAPVHDGCVDCKYFDCGEDEDPCVRCKNRYVDKWEAKDE